MTPCSPRCGVWLIYGIQPKGARLGTVPGQCKGKAHKSEYLGIAGRRVLVSRKWSGKTLADHAGERAAFVRQLLTATGVRPGYAVDDGPFEWEPTKAGDPDVPTRPALLLQAISEEKRTAPPCLRLPNGHLRVRRGDLLDWLEGLRDAPGRAA